MVHNGTIKTPYIETIDSSLKELFGFQDFLYTNFYFHELVSMA